MLDIGELEELIDEVIEKKILANQTGELEELKDKIREKITQANRFEKLDDLLEQWGMSELLNPKKDLYQSFKYGKILIIGSSSIKKAEIIGVFKNFGIQKDRIELCLDYKKAQKYNFKKLKYSTIYSVVMIGPIPHSTVGKGNSSSIITELENREGYPPIIRLGNEGLKITKADLSKKVKRLVNDKCI